MTKDEFISAMSEKNKITIREERLKSIKSFLIDNIKKDTQAHEKYPDTHLKSKYVYKYHTKCITVKNSTVYPKNIVCTTHPRYRGKSPIEMLMGEGKRIPEALDCLAEEPDYYFDNKREKQGDPISYSCYIDDETKQQQFIVDEGNHRSALGIITSTICSDQVSISYVPVSTYEINWNLASKIQHAEELMKKNNIEFKIERDYKSFTVEGNDISYNIIKQISLWDEDEHEYIYNEMYSNDKENLEECMKINESKLNDFCNQIDSYIPQHKLSEDEGNVAISMFDKIRQWLFS